MRLLVLGGTTFVGWHLVERALALGHEVTTFTRGRSGPPPAGARALHGDRAGDLAVLRGGRWDAVVDTSGYDPEIVGRSAAALAGATGHYAFVSSGSVYADHSRGPIGEDAPTATEPADGYGTLKAACERVVAEHCPGRSHVIRAGLIVGPRDPTGRATWWVRRIARGGEVLVPAPTDQPLQLVDVRDLGDWIVRCCEARVTGVMNATSPVLPLHAFFDACREAAGSDARFVAVDEAWLVEQGVTPWEDLPLWVAPSVDPGFAAFLDLDVERARGASVPLRGRALVETARAILADDTPRPATGFGPPVAEPGLSADRERRLLGAWREAQ